MNLEVSQPAVGMAADTSVSLARWKQCEQAVVGTVF